MSGMTVTAFVYATNSTVLINDHVRHGLLSASLTHPAHSNSSLISELLLVWLSIQHTLFLGTDSLLLFNHGIKLLIFNIVPMHIPLGPFLLRSRSAIGQSSLINARFRISTTKIFLSK